MNLRINKKIISLLALGSLAIPFHFSNANILTDTIGKSVIGGFAWVISTILYLVGFVASKAVFYGGLFFNWTLELNNALIDNPVVSIGWSLTRDIANLGFVLLIIIIAFSTILRLGSFQMKSALSKLIIAALLINFSLILAAIVIDSAGIFMSFFLNNAFDTTKTQGGLSQALATSLGLHSGLQPPPITGNTDLSTFGVGIMNYIASMLFVVIMTIVGAITMFTLGAMFLLRYLNLGILLILLPGAILGWVAGSSVWSDWTKKFLNYTFFGPVAAFFVYIALKSAFIFKSSAKTYFANPTAGDAVLQNFAGDLGAMIMLVFLLLLGLKSAESIAGSLSVGGLKIANAAISGVLKGTAATSLGLATGGRMKQVSQWASSVGKKSSSPFVRGITRPLRQIGGDTKDFYQKYGGVTGIFTGTTEGISEGMGFSSRKLRLKETKEFEKNVQPKLDKIKAKKAEINPLNKELESINSALKVEEEKPVSSRQSRMGEINKLKEKKEEIAKKIEGINKEISDIEKAPPPKKDEVGELKERLEKIEEEKKSK